MRCTLNPPSLFASSRMQKCTVPCPALPALLGGICCSPTRTFERPLFNLSLQFPAEGASTTSVQTRKDQYRVTQGHRCTEGWCEGGAPAGIGLDPQLEEGGDGGKQVAQARAQHCPHADVVQTEQPPLLLRQPRLPLQLPLQQLGRPASQMSLIVIWHVSSVVFCALDCLWGPIVAFEKQSQIPGGPDALSSEPD